jgi:hypothetical protein
MTTPTQLGDDLQLPSPTGRQIPFDISPVSPLRFDDAFFMPDVASPLLTHLTAGPLPVPQVRRPSAARRLPAVFRPFTSFDALELTVKELAKQLCHEERWPRRSGVDYVQFRDDRRIFE